MKKLKLYYLYVGIPVALVVLGTILFFKQIMGTIDGNPHPQINYLIFVLIALGCTQMMLHVRRINREGDGIQRFSKAIRNKESKETIQAMLDEHDKKFRTDSSDVLQVVNALYGQKVTSVQHAALESELERFSARQSRRLLLSQFLSGMMVGLGLLGTFIGLLGALAEIGKLIGSFNIDKGMDDPVAAVGGLVAHLTAPMQAMGVAFSASLFGVLGSLIMGLLMVSVKGAASDLVSILQSRVAMMLDISEHHEGNFPDLEPVAIAMKELAEKSPMLRGLAVALDQSERRVRELIASVAQLSSRVDYGTQTSQGLLEQFNKQVDQQTQNTQQIKELREDLSRLVTHQTSLLQNTDEVNQALQRQHDWVLGVTLTQKEEFQNFVAQHGEQTTKHQESMLRMMQSQQADSAKAMEAQLQFSQEREANERRYWVGQNENFAKSQQSILQAINGYFGQAERLASEQQASLTRVLEVMMQGQKSTAVVNADLAKYMSEAGASMRSENLSRMEMIHQMNAMFTEAQARQEQLLQTLIVVLENVNAKTDAGK
jgi:hypothetical protein